MATSTLLGLAWAAGAVEGSSVLRNGNATAVRGGGGASRDDKEDGGHGDRQAAASSHEDRRGGAPSIPVAPAPHRLVVPSILYGSLSVPLGLVGGSPGPVFVDALSRMAGIDAAARARGSDADADSSNANANAGGDSSGDSASFDHTEERRQQQQQHHKEEEELWRQREMRREITGSIPFAGGGGWAPSTSRASAGDGSRSSDRSGSSGSEFTSGRLPKRRMKLLVAPTPSLSSDDGDEVTPEGAEAGASNGASNAASAMNAENGSATVDATASASASASSTAEAVRKMREDNRRALEALRSESNRRRGRSLGGDREEEGDEAAAAVSGTASSSSWSQSQSQGAAAAPASRSASAAFASPQPRSSGAMTNYGPNNSSSSSRYVSTLHRSSMLPTPLAEAMRRSRTLLVGAALASFVVTRYAEVRDERRARMEEEERRRGWVRSAGRDERAVREYLYGADNAAVVADEAGGSAGEAGGQSGIGFALEYLRSMQDNLFGAMNDGASTGSKLNDDDDATTSSSDEFNGVAIRLVDGADSGWRDTVARLVRRCDGGDDSGRCDRQKVLPVVIGGSPFAPGATGPSDAALSAAAAAAAAGGLVYWRLLLGGGGGSPYGTAAYTTDGASARSSGDGATNATTLPLSDDWLLRPRSKSGGAEHPSESDGAETEQQRPPVLVVEADVSRPLSAYLASRYGGDLDNRDGERRDGPNNRQLQHAAPRLSPTRANLATRLIEAAAVGRGVLPPPQPASLLSLEQKSTIFSYTSAAESGESDNLPSSYFETTDSGPLAAAADGEAAAEGKAETEAGTAVEEAAPEIVTVYVTSGDDGQRQRRRQERTVFVDGVAGVAAAIGDAVEAAVSASSSCGVAPSGEGGGGDGEEGRAIEGEAVAAADASDALDAGVNSSATEFDDIDNGINSDEVASSTSASAETHEDGDSEREESMLSSLREEEEALGEGRQTPQDQLPSSDMSPASSLPSSTSSSSSSSSPANPLLLIDAIGRGVRYTLWTAVGSVAYVVTLGGAFGRLRSRATSTAADGDGGKKVVVHLFADGTTERWFRDDAILEGRGWEVVTHGMSTTLSADFVQDKGKMEGNNDRGAAIHVVVVCCMSDDITSDVACSVLSARPDLAKDGRIVALLQERSSGETLQAMAQELLLSLEASSGSGSIGCGQKHGLRSLCIDSIHDDLFEAARALLAEGRSPAEVQASMDDRLS